MPRKKTEGTSKKAPKTGLRKTTAKLKAKTKKTATAVKRTRKAVKPRKTARVSTKSKSAESPSLTAENLKTLPWPLSSHGRPRRFGETQVVAFVRDPHSIYTYWEVATESVEEVKKRLREEFKDSLLVLRVFRTNAQGLSEFLYEVEVAPGAQSHYLTVDGTGHGVFVEVAQKTPSGKYAVYARSKTLALPGGSPSKIVDARWIPPAELKEYFEKEVATPSSVALSSTQAAQRKPGTVRLSSRL